jgi:hypothetical protein
METVAQLFGAQPRLQIAAPELWPKPTNVWANYDAETDSMIIYLTGKPVRGVQVYLHDDIYAIVDPATRHIIGMYVEAWERSFVPAHPDIQEMWRQVKPSVAPEIGWNQLLRAIALWIFLLLSPEANNPQQFLRPV